MKFFLIILIMACFTGCSSVNEAENSAKFSSLKAGEQIFQVEVAKDNEARQKGLMFRQELPENQGMLFVFDRMDNYSFWMKNTLIPLDIIWISEDKKVVDIQTLHPCTEEKCESYLSPHKALYVLEIGAGKFRGKLGDEVQF